MIAPHRPVDRAAFLELYRQTAEPLRRYAARGLGSASAADDVVQEAYVRALASKGFPADPDEGRAYLFRVVSNLMIDHWRRRRRELEHATMEEAAAAVNDPAARMDVTKLFAQLKLQERQLIWLAHVEGADHAAIAAALKVGAGSVKVLLHRARAKFADLLRKGGYGQDWRRDNDQ